MILNVELGRISKEVVVAKFKALPWNLSSGYYFIWSTILSNYESTTCNVMWLKKNSYEGGSDRIQVLSRYFHKNLDEICEMFQA